MKNWFWPVCIVCGVIIFAIVFGQMLFQAAVLKIFPPETPLSIAIVAAIYESPRGHTDVSEPLCALATPNALEVSADELWPLNADMGAAFREPSGTLIGSFSKANNLLEGVQTLWILVYPEQPCRAHIQSYSW